MQNDFQSLGFSKMPQQIEMMSMSELGFDFAQYSIKEYLKVKGIPNKILLPEILFQMVEAVEQMHGHGFVHHDIKTDNFRIMGNRVVLGYL